MLLCLWEVRIFLMALVWLSKTISRTQHPIGLLAWSYLDFRPHLSFPEFQGLMGLSAVCSASLRLGFFWSHWGWHFPEGGNFLRNSEQQRCLGREGVPFIHPREHQEWGSWGMNNFAISNGSLHLCLCSWVLLEQIAMGEELLKLAGWVKVECNVISPLESQVYCSHGGGAGFQ